MSALDRSPRANWVERAGGLPPYIERVALAIERAQPGWPLSRVIAVAINAVKRMAATGDVNFPGRQNVNAVSRAQAARALAQWEALKARAKDLSVPTGKEPTVKTPMPTPPLTKADLARMTPAQKRRLLAKAREMAAKKGAPADSGK